MVALYKECKAFIFPSIYEGFGIPPLEAMECGCDNIILSNIPVFKEIYSDYATYINLSNPNYDLNKLCYRRKNQYDKLLKKYTWTNVANTIIRELFKW